MLELWDVAGYGLFQSESRVVFQEGQFLNALCLIYDISDDIGVL